MLGAVAALAIGSFFAVPAAHAAPLNTPTPGTYGSVTCTYFHDGTADYPDHPSSGDSWFIDCTGDLTLRATYSLTISGEPNTHTDPAPTGVGLRDRLENKKITYYFFNNWSEYKAYFDGWSNSVNGVPYDVDEIGPSTDAATSIYIQGSLGESYVVVFKNGPNFDSGVPPTTTETKTGEQIRHLASHETGHVLDELWKSIMSGGVKPSDHSDFRDVLLKHDRFYYDYIYSTGSTLLITGVRNACGVGGEFNGIWDYRNSRYVCNGTNGNGSSLSSDIYRNVYSGGVKKDKLNSEILKVITPEMFNFSSLTLHPYSELFAEMYSIVAAHTVSSTTKKAETTVSLLAKNFTSCSRVQLVAALRSQAKQPTSYSFQCTRPLDPNPWPTEHP